MTTPTTYRVLDQRTADGLAAVEAAAVTMDTAGKAVRLGFPGVPVVERVLGTARGELPAALALGP